MSYLNVAGAAASAASSAVSTANVAAIGAQALSGIAMTIAGISDMNKRRRFEESLALLDNRQKRELNEKLLQAQSHNDRLAILSNSVVEFAIANENKAARQEMVLYVVAGVLGIVIISGAIFYAVKTKK